MSSRDRADRTIVPGIYLDAWEYEGVYPSGIGHSPRLRTSSKMQDAAGRSAMVSMTGELHVAGKVDEVNINFQYGLRTANAVIAQSGTGSTGTVKSTGSASAGTGIGSASIISKNPVRYRAGHESHCALSCIFGAAQAGVNQYAGFLNTTDTFAVGYNGASFGIWFIEGGNVTFVDQSSFNIDKVDGTGKSGFKINPQMGNLYRLTFTWHGFLPLMLEIADGLEWRPVHILDFTNKITETHLENPHIPVGVKIERLSGSGAAVSIRSGSIRAGSIAFTDDDAASDYWTAHTQLDTALVSSARTNIFTLRNKTSYFGKNNHIVYELGVVTFDSAANKSVAVYGTKGATITGGSVYADLDTVNSPIEFSNGGTVTGGTRGPATVIKAGGDRRTDVLGTGILIYPGDAFTFEVDPGGAVNGTFSISARIVGRH
jgi:hypothetical protein